MFNRKNDIEFSYVMIKPDGVRKGEELLEKRAIEILKKESEKSDDTFFTGEEVEIIMSYKTPKEQRKPESNLLLKEVVKIFNENGLEVFGISWDNLKGEDKKLSEHYGHVKKITSDDDPNLGLKIYNNLYKLMTSGRVIKMVVVGNDAISKVRSLIGPTNVTKAKEQSPDSIRARYGTEHSEEYGESANVIHASGNKKEAAEEVLRFYPIESLYDVIDSEIRINKSQKKFFDEKKDEKNKKINK